SELDFPINICEGCLVRYPAYAAATTNPGGSAYTCSTSATTTQTTEVAPCVQGQDAPFACTFCSAAYEICRDPKANKASPTTP
ncbi:MAG: hypothetical protein ABIQ16_24020, partial [Polyangiaceae bacterium]